MLTSKQEKFVNNLVKGMSQRIAYRDAYPSSKKWKDEIVDSKASTLLKNGKVMERYNELIGKVRAKEEEHTIMSALERKEWLTKVINNEILEEEKYIVEEKEITLKKPTNVRTKITALDTLNKMDGNYIQDIRLSGDKNNPIFAQTTVIEDVAKQMLNVNEEDIDVEINS